MLRRREFLAGAGVVVAEVATTSLALASKFKIDPSVSLAATAESSSAKNSNARRYGGRGPSAGNHGLL